MTGTLAILGTGRMGEAVLRGLLRSGWAQPDQLWCTVRRPERAAELAQAYGVHAGTDSLAAVEAADVVVLAVKPQSLRALLGEVGPGIGARHTVISVAAGVTTGVVESLLAEGTPVVRVMTNTAVQVDQAMSVITAGAHAGEEELGVAEAILSPVGRVLRLDEDQLDAVTAVSGSGPAYLFLVAEAMIDAGVLLGLRRDVAADLCAQTLLGSAMLLRDTGQSPAELRAAVSSPGGTTVAGLRVLEQEGVRAALINAVEAAWRRSGELGAAPGLDDP